MGQGGKIFAGLPDEGTQPGEDFSTGKGKWTKVRERVAWRQKGLAALPQATGAGDHEPFSVSFVTG
jgi:hypothetical protein